MIIFSILCILIGIFAHEGFRRFPKMAALFFGALPLGFLPLWLHISTSYRLFVWGKLYSATAAACFLLLVRFTRLKNHKWSYGLIYFLMICNLLEAIVTVFSIQSIPGALTGIAGILLIATLPPLRSLQVVSKAPHDIEWDLSYSWILCYTVWDWTFIYLWSPACAGWTTIVLLAPLLVSFKNRKLWGQARTCTLPFYLILAFSFSFLLNWIDTSSWANVYVGWAAAILASVWMVVHTLVVYVFKPSVR